MRWPAVWGIFGLFATCFSGQVAAQVKMDVQSSELMRFFNGTLISDLVVGDSAHISTGSLCRNELDELHIIGIAPIVERPDEPYIERLLVKKLPGGSFEGTLVSGDKIIDRVKRFKLERTFLENLITVNKCAQIFEYYYISSELITYPLNRINDYESISRMFIDHKELNKKN